jgi:hypothetical protein
MRWGSPSFKSGANIRVVMAQRCSVGIGMLFVVSVAKCFCIRVMSAVLIFGN